MHLKKSHDDSYRGTLRSNRFVTSNLIWNLRFCVIAKNDDYLESSGKW